MELALGLFEGLILCSRNDENFSQLTSYSFRYLLTELGTDL